MSKASRSILSKLGAFNRTQESVGVELRVSLSELLVRTLRIRGWSQRQLAAAADVKEPFVSRILHGNVNCTLDTIGNLLFALGVRAKFEETPRILDGIHGTTKTFKLFRQEGTHVTGTAGTSSSTDANIKWRDRVA